MRSRCRLSLKPTNVFISVFHLPVFRFCRQSRIGDRVAGTNPYYLGPFAFSDLVVVVAEACRRPPTISPTWRDVLEELPFSPWRLPTRPPTGSVAGDGYEVPRLELPAHPGWDISPVLPLLHYRHLSADPLLLELFESARLLFPSFCGIALSIGQPPFGDHRYPKFYQYQPILQRRPWPTWTTRVCDMISRAKHRNETILEMTVSTAGKYRMISHSKKPQLCQLLREKLPTLRKWWKRKSLISDWWNENSLAQKFCCHWCRSDA